MLHTLIRWRLQPFGACESEELLAEFLAAFADVARIVEELGDLLVAHDVPHAITRHHDPLRDDAARIRIVRLQVESER